MVLSDQIQFKLNKEQQSASLPNRGICLVIAGAGTGKTKTLIEKVNNIISEGISKPESILILTFSRKAALEIKSRIKQKIGNDAYNITSGTFHSFCLRFLKNYSRYFLSYYNYKKFPKVLGGVKRKLILNNLLRSSIDKFLGLPVNVVSGLTEGAERLDKRTYQKLEHLGIIKELDNFNQSFMEYKVSNNLIDFTDMMNYTIEILLKNNSIRREINNKYRYILVDEFQDTSEDNFKLMSLLLNENDPNLFLVGDDWQSIYGFRGSRIDYIVNMKKYFPGSAIYKLIINYRSKKEIVKLSNYFIRKNKKRTRKKLKSFKGRGGLVRDYLVENLKEEALVVKNIIKDELMNSDKSAIAVLYRNNWQKDILIKELQSHDVSLDSIEFMTMHSSKGLEFDTVIITGVSDDIIPDSSNEIEEERRLFYVALTRARDKLYIVHHKSAYRGLSVFAEELGFSSGS